MRNLARMGLMAAALALSHTPAGAAVYNLQFGAASGSQDLTATPLELGDGIGVHGFFDHQEGLNYDNKVSFTAGAGVTKISSAATWFALPPFANSLSYSLLDSDGNVLATDVGPTFGGDGTVRGSLVFAGLVPGDSYSIAIAGKLFAVGNYDLKLGVTPIPASLALLAPALGGLGALYVRRLRRQPGEAC